MNFNKLRYVAAVDRAASITAAAQVLNISQSAVTKAVADIEAELGFAIFERRSHGVTTTGAGRDFINRAARILSDIDHLADDMRDNRRTTEMLLRVAITPASLEALMNRATVALLGAHPQMRLHMRGVSLERGAQLLRQGPTFQAALDRMRTVSDHRAGYPGPAGHAFARRAWPSRRQSNAPPAHHRDISDCGQTRR